MYYIFLIYTLIMFSGGNWEMTTPNVVGDLLLSTNMMRLQYLMGFIVMLLYSP